MIPNNHFEIMKSNQKAIELSARFGITLETAEDEFSGMNLFGSDITRKQRFMYFAGEFLSGLNPWGISSITRTENQLSILRSQLIQDCLILNDEKLLENELEVKEVQTHLVNITKMEYERDPHKLITKIFRIQAEELDNVKEQLNAIKNNLDKWNSHTHPIKPEEIGPNQDQAEIWKQILCDRKASLEKREYLLSVVIITIAKLTETELCLNP